MMRINLNFQLTCNYWHAHCFTWTDKSFEQFLKRNPHLIFCLFLCQAFECLKGHMFLFEERMSSSHPDLRICVWVVAVFVCTVFCKVDGYVLEHVPQRSLGVNGIFYFQADTPRFGIEMWRSDGTSSGTWLLKDIYNGTKSSTPSYFFECNTTFTLQGITCNTCNC